MLCNEILNRSFCRQLFAQSFDFEIIFRKLPIRICSPFCKGIVENTVLAVFRKLNRIIRGCKNTVVKILLIRCQFVAVFWRRCILIIVANRADVCFPTGFERCTCVCSIRHEHEGICRLGRNMRNSLCSTVQVLGGPIHICQRDSAVPFIN